MTLLDIFRAPPFDEPRTSRAAAVLAPLLAFLAVAMFGVACMGLTVDWAEAWQVVGTYFAVLVFVAMRVSVQRGRVQLAAAVTTGLLFTISTSSLLADKTPGAYPVAYAVAIAIGGITLRRPGPFWLGGVAALSVLAAPFAAGAGVFSFNRPAEETGIIVMQAIGFSMLGATMHWANRALDKARDRAAEQEARNQDLQQSLFASQRMEAIGRLAGGIAHDFNNVLTVVSGNAAVLGFNEAQTPEDRESCDAIIKAAESGANLTRQLLAFGGRQVVKPEVLDVADVLSDFRPVLEHMGGKERTELEVRAEAGGGCVRADPGQLQHAVGNLVLNAAHASDSGGRIEVTLQSVSLDVDQALSHGTLPAGRYQVIKVVDHGVGMDEATLAAAFEPFFTTRKNEGGSGLGLAVVHGVATQFGGQVEIESELGEGTAVSLWLPVVDEKPTWKPKNRPVKIEGMLEGMRVLLVDDDDAARKAVRRQLEEVGATVEDFSRGDDALARFAKGAPAFSAAIVDVIMPSMSGPQLVLRLRDVGWDAPLAFLTGYADPDRLRGELAATPVLYKPVATGELVRTLTAEREAAE